MQKTTAHYAEVAPHLILHATGASVESVKINTDGTRAWIIVRPDATKVINPSTGKVWACSTADGAMRVLDQIIGMGGF